MKKKHPIGKAIIQLFMWVKGKGGKQQALEIRYPELLVFDN
ncbi:hypothetical protein [Cyclobacterium qasimii]|nr:hypothetical protein [Cyclobacterium qasimii]